MSKELVCPFCNKPLQPTPRQSDEYWCENYDCPGTNIEWVGSQKLWQELIRTRKALDVAVDALKVYANRENWDFEHFYSLETYDIASEALDKITALEQKD